MGFNNFTLAFMWSGCPHTIQKNIQKTQRISCPGSHRQPAPCRECHWPWWQHWPTHPLAFAAAPPLLRGAWSWYVLMASNWWVQNGFNNRWCDEGRVLPRTNSKYPSHADWRYLTQRLQREWQVRILSQSCPVKHIVKIVRHRKFHISSACWYTIGILTFDSALSNGTVKCQAFSWYTCCKCLLLSHWITSWAFTSQQNHYKKNGAECSPSL